jgi:hypothetical protein
MRNSSIDVSINGIDNVSGVLAGITAKGVVMGNAISGAIGLAANGVGQMMQGLKGQFESAQNVQMGMIGTSGALMGVIGTDYANAMQVTKDLNKEFTRMASTLPGVTEDFAQIGLSISDDIFNAIRTADGSVDLPNAKKLLLEMTEGWGLLAQQSQTSSAEASQNLVRFLGGDATVLKMAQFDKSPAFKSALNRVMEADDMALSDWSDATTEQRAKWINQASKMTIPKEAIDELRQTVDGVYQGWRSAVFDPTSGALGFLREIGSRGDETVMDALSDAMQAADKMFKALADNFPFKFDVLAPLFDTFKFIERQINRVTNLIGGTFSIQGIVKAAQSLSESIVSTIDNAVTKASRGLSSMLQGLGSVDLSSMMDVVSGIGGAMQTLVKGLRIQSLRLVSGMFNGITEALLQLPTSMTDISGEIAGFMSGMFADVSSMMSQTMSSINLSGLISGLTRLGLIGVDLISQMINGLAKSLNMGAIESVLSGYNVGVVVGQVLGDSFMGLAQIVARTLGSIDITLVIGAVQSLAKMLGGAVVGLLVGLGQSIVANFPAYIAEIDNGIKRFQSNISGGVQRYIAAIGSLVSSGMTAIVEVIRGLMDGVVRTFKSAIPQALSSITNAISNLRSAVTVTAPPVTTPAPTPAVTTPSTATGGTRASEPSSRSDYVSTVRNLSRSTTTTSNVTAAEQRALETAQNSASGNFTPLLDAIRRERKASPFGSSITVANTSETILNKNQTRTLAKSVANGRTAQTVNVNLNVNGVSNPMQVAELVMRELDKLVMV